MKPKSIKTPIGDRTIGEQEFHQFLQGDVKLIRDSFISEKEANEFHKQLSTGKRVNYYCNGEPITLQVGILKEPEQDGFQYSVSYYLFKTK